MRTRWRADGGACTRTRAHTRVHTHKPAGYTIVTGCVSVRLGLRPAMNQHKMNSKRTFHFLFASIVLATLFISLLFFGGGWGGSFVTWRPARSTNRRLPQAGAHPSHQPSQQSPVLPQLIGAGNKITINNSTIFPFFLLMSLHFFPSHCVSYTVYMCVCVCV